METIWKISKVWVKQKINNGRIRYNCSLGKEFSIASSAILRNLKRVFASKTDDKRDWERQSKEIYKIKFDRLLVIKGEGRFTFKISTEKRNFVRRPYLNVC